MVAIARRDFIRASLMFSTSFAVQFTDLLAATKSTHPQRRRDWQILRAQTLSGMQKVMGPLPKLTKSSPHLIKLQSEETNAFTRTKIKYLSEPGDYVDAFLLIPRRLQRQTAAMLCLHQTVKSGKEEPAGLSGNPNLHYAQELAERGYVCIVPDYPYLGENQFDPYAHGYLSCTMKGIVNHIRAVDVLQSRPEVRKDRIGSIGHSLGGHNTLFVAAFDTRIKAMVSSCGFTKFGKYYSGNLKGWAGVRYMPIIEKQYNNDPQLIPFDFPELIASLAPRPLFVNAPLSDSNFDVSGVRDCEAVARPVYQRVFKANDRLDFHYPDAGHEFQTAMREKAYAFLDRWLR